MTTSGTTPGREPQSRGETTAVFSCPWTALAYLSEEADGQASSPAMVSLSGSGAWGLASHQPISPGRLSDTTSDRGSGQAWLDRISGVSKPLAHPGFRTGIVFSPLCPISSDLGTARFHPLRAGERSLATGLFPFKLAMTDGGLGVLDVSQRIPRLWCPKNHRVFATQLNPLPAGSVGFFG